MIENEFFTLFQTKYRKLEDYYHTFNLMDQAALLLVTTLFLLMEIPHY